jgi:ABC-2 type transport system ATP-binding protein
MKSIEINSLTKTFGNFTAVDNITFSVEIGEIFGFLGPNGAGKTTTIRMLCGILKPTAGSGTVAGFDILKENERIKTRIGYMSQKFSLYRDLTVAENIDFFAGIYRIANPLKTERKSWALETVGLLEFKDHLTQELPTGFKQRLGLVCALLHSPPIIFLDEPTAGVDPASRRDFWDLIYRLKREAKTTIFVTTHYMDEAEHCERIALIQSGTIAAIGSPAELKKSLKTKVFVVQGNPFFTIKEIIEKAEGIENVVPFGKSFHVFFQDEKSSELVKHQLSRADINITRFEPIEPALEDVFISVMKNAD